MEIIFPRYKKRLIDSYELIEKFKLFRYSTYISIDIVFDEIARAQEIEAVPVIHARYIVDKLGNVVCSNCKEKHIEGVKNYCPNCGAKIDYEL